MDASPCDPFDEFIEWFNHLQTRLKWIGPGSKTTPLPANSIHTYLAESSRVATPIILLYLYNFKVATCGRQNRSGQCPFGCTCYARRQGTKPTSVIKRFGVSQKQSRKIHLGRNAKKEKWKAFHSTSPFASRIDWIDASQVSTYYSMMGNSNKTYC